MAFSMIAIAFLSWIVWGHHMFLSGMNPLLGMAFMMTTMVIAVPSAIKSFQLARHAVGRHDPLDLADAVCLGIRSMFVIGGLSGIFMAATPVDIYIHDTYFIVAHIHYVVAGIIFAIFAAIYYWFPKMFGRMMNEPLGKIHFCAHLIFFNGTFFPMHILGVGGHMRRIYNPTQYEFLQPMQHWNVFITDQRAAAWARRRFSSCSTSSGVCSPARRRSAIPGRPTPWSGRRRRRRRTATSRYSRWSTAAPTSTARRKSKRIGCRKIKISVLPPQRERINGKLEI